MERVRPTSTVLHRNINVLKPNAPYMEYRQTILQDVITALRYSLDIYKWHPTQTQQILNLRSGGKHSVAQA